MSNTESGSQTNLCCHMCLKQPHMEAKHGQLLCHVLKAATHGGKAWAAVDPCA